MQVIKNPEEFPGLLTTSEIRSDERRVTLQRVLRIVADELVRVEAKRKDAVRTADLAHIRDWEGRAKSLDWVRHQLRLLIEMEVGDA